MSELVERIRSEAAIADRPGSLSRLSDIANQVAELERRLAYHSRLGLSAIFLADSVGEDGVDEIKAEYDRVLLMRGWYQGASSRQCHCAAYSEGECACGNYPSEPNPYT